IGNSIFQDDRDPNTIFLGTNLGVYRSTDRGASWAPIAARPARPSRPAKRTVARRNTRKPAPKPRGASSARATPPVSSPGERIVSQAKPADDVVKRAQEALDRAGYEIGIADGQMGPRTIAAIKRFQTDRYMGVTGQLD